MSDAAKPEPKPDPIQTESVEELQKILDARKQRPKATHPTVAARWKREDEELEARIAALKKGKK